MSVFGKWERSFILALLDTEALASKNAGNTGERRAEIPIQIDPNGGFRRDGLDLFAQFCRCEDLP